MHHQSASPMADQLREGRQQIVLFIEEKPLTDRHMVMAKRDLQPDWIADELVEERAHLDCGGR